MTCLRRQRRAVDQIDCPPGIHKHRRTAAQGRIVRSAQKSACLWGAASRRFQMEGANSSSMGKISSRPTSMSKDSSSLEKGEKLEKLPTGPTIYRPGPTLLMQVATAVNTVTRSICSRETSRQDSTKMAIYTARNR